jgi:peptide/nickel transport system substrate-binding protein
MTDSDQRGHAQMQTPDRANRDSALTRRDLLRGGVAAAAFVTSGGLISACGGSSTTISPPTGVATGRIRAGGTLSVGLTGGSAKDTLDAHAPVSDPDIGRNYQLYEGLTYLDTSVQVRLLLAESLESNAHADVWTIRLRPDLEFHNGKPVTADDVMFTFQRILNPAKPQVAASTLAPVDLHRLTKLDNRTVRVTMQRPMSEFPEALSVYAAIVPRGYDPRHPVGTGPFKFDSFTPGQQSVFTRFNHYWQKGRPYLDRIVMIDFPDTTARTNALLSGQVDVIDNVPAAEMSTVSASGLTILDSPTGTWLPFTMRVDVPPFNDVRVRQAMRLIVDRKQMVEQALDGHGGVGNDLYARYDQAYDTLLPQREQDLEQARSLLKQAGRSGLHVALQTAPVAQGLVEAAQVFAQQASGAGVQVAISNLDPATFFGPNYLHWTFAQDFWNAFPYMLQADQSTVSKAPYNETHWRDPQYERLITQARATTKTSLRTEILREAQRIEYDRGGYIVWAFANQIDGHKKTVGGLTGSRVGPLNHYDFRSVGFVV